MHGLNISEFTGFIFLGALAAGFFGSMTGLGGGVIIVPLLTLIFGVDIRYAAGASLVSVIATSSGAAAAYVREGFSNIRVAMFLEVATTIGALSGAFLAARLQTSVISIIFGAVLLFSAYFSRKPPKNISGPEKTDRIAALLKMDSSYPAGGSFRHYNVAGVPAGFGIMYVAGVVSGLLGIGSGALKVLAMDRAMRLPFKVSTTTSNFMIGVTAAASAGVYLNRGYIDPALAMPVMLGVLTGSAIGARVLVKAQVRSIRLLFLAVLIVLAVEMIYNGVTGRL
ncbi:MAG: sulfite exporter TauE/SafE family protein [Nitrospirota bacterium]